MQRICSIPKHSIYVGDTIYDIKAAHAAGCSSIGAAWGAMNLPLLKSAEPTWLLDHFTQVGNLLE
jgi:phosphoglycolate phosphatase-like HAD superfamily hydrolase